METLSKDIALNIRQETRDLCLRLRYETNLEDWDIYKQEDLGVFLGLFLELGTPTPLEAQLIGLHLWALEQHNACFPGDIVPVLANAGFCGFGPNPKLYYQPLTGKITDSPKVWMDRHWGPVYRIEFDRAERVERDHI